MNNNCSKARIAVIGLLLVIATIASLTSRSDCPDSVDFTQHPPQNVAVPCGAHEVPIPCDYAPESGIQTRPEIPGASSQRVRVPNWYINSTLYDRTNSKYDGFYISGTSLIVANISQPYLNNTQFYCQRQLIANGSGPCIHNGLLHQLIIKDCKGPKVEYIPVYSYNRNNSLQEIHTTLNLTEIEEDDTVVHILYKVVYSNSWGNSSSVVSCTEKDCRHAFKVPPKWSNMPNISVTALTTNSAADTNFWKSETMIIDTLNTFINVSVFKSGSDGSRKPAIRCEFLDPVLSSRRWYCAVRYGSVHSDCRNLTETEEILGEQKDTKSATFGSINLGNCTEICVTATVRSGNKQWRLEGIFSVIPDSAKSIFRAQTNLILVGYIELVAIVLIY